ncbi:MAG TPA: hypothetical protein VFQ85_04020 [Mycobacteriales bacterium]|jgi:hypothetical protein|nr:hypothetical protein [Mycobacteriales bacterium]
MRRLGGAAVLLVLLVACARGQDPLRGAMGNQPYTPLLRHGRLRVGVHREDPGRVCFGYVGSRQGGGHCMINTGWALEVATASPGPTSILMVVGDPRTAEVRIPRTDGGTLTVRPRYLPKEDAYAAVVEVDLSTLRLGRNAPAAYDAQGRLLGHTHDCAGLGGPPDCGPYTGLIDERMPRPSPVP